MKWICILFLMIAIVICYFVSVYHKMRKLQVMAADAFASVICYEKQRLQHIIQLFNHTESKSFVNHNWYDVFASTLLLIKNINSMDEYIRWEKKTMEDYMCFKKEIEIYLRSHDDLCLKEFYDECMRMETCISQARKYYNAICTKYNHYTDRFLHNTLAGIFHMERNALYDEKEVNDKIVF